MAVTAYLVPAVPINLGTTSGFIAKYGDASNRTGIPVGREGFYILFLTDPDPTLDATIVADPECTKIPSFANTVTAGALANVQAKVEAIGIPAQWITVGMTYQMVVRNCLRISQLYLRLAGLGVAKVLASGVTLNTQWNALPNGIQNKMLAMADSFGFDKSGLSGTSTLRQILKALADQWISELPIRGVSF